MKRLRKESEQDGNSEKTHKGCRPDAAAEPRSRDDLGLPLTTRVIGRAHLKPLLVHWSSGDVEIFDRFILQLLRAKGIAGEPVDPSQVSPIICLAPFRPMYVSATPSSPEGGSGGGVGPKPTEDEGIKKIWRISPVSIRTYIEDLLMQPILLETFISRGRDLGLADVGQSVLRGELLRMVQLLDMAAAEDMASLQLEEKEMVREGRRRCAAAARQAAKMKEATSAAAAAAEDAALAAAAATGGFDVYDVCLPRCEDLIIIGIGIGKGGSGKDTDDLEKRQGSDDDLRRRRMKDEKTGGTGDQGDGQGTGQGAGGEGGIGDSSLRSFGDDGRKGKKGKKKKKKKKKPGKGGGGGSDDGDGDGEEEGEGEGDGGDHDKKDGDHDDDDDYDYDDDDDGHGGHHDHDHDHDHDGAGTERDDHVDWDSKLKDEIIPVPSPPLYSRPAPSSVGTFVLPSRGSMLHRGSMYSLQFTPAFVFSYFQTMPPHYNDDAQLLMLFDRYGGNRRTKGNKQEPINK